MAQPDVDTRTCILELYQVDSMAAAMRVYDTGAQRTQQEPCATGEVSLPCRYNHDGSRDRIMSRLTLSDVQQVLQHASGVLRIPEANRRYVRGMTAHRRRGNRGK